MKCELTQHCRHVSSHHLHTYLRPNYCSIPIQCLHRLCSICMHGCRKISGYGYIWWSAVDFTALSLWCSLFTECLVKDVTFLLKLHYLVPGYTRKPPNIGHWPQRPRRQTADSQIACFQLTSLGVIIHLCQRQHATHLFTGSTINLLDTSFIQFGSTVSVPHLWLRATRRVGDEVKIVLLNDRYALWLHFLFSSTVRYNCSSCTVPPECFI